MITVPKLLPFAIALAWLFAMPASGEVIATVSGTSPSGAIAWSVNPVNGDIMLIPSTGGGTSKKLCSTVNRANVKVHFSPDDRYVFLTDGTPRTGIYVTLYKRSSGLSYTKVTGIDFPFAVQRLAMEVQEGKKVTDPVLDRSNLECTGWSKDGKRAIFQLSGNGTSAGKKITITGFTCSYDPAARVFSSAK